MVGAGVLFLLLDEEEATAFSFAEGRRLWRSTLPSVLDLRARSTPQPASAGGYRGRLLPLE